MSEYVELARRLARVVEELRQLEAEIQAALDPEPVPAVDEREADDEDPFEPGARSEP